jgi:rare lipoprotein A
MLRNAHVLFKVFAIGFLAAACANTHPQNTVSLPSNAGVYKVGNPYQIDGTWYYPREQPNYDETGIASWYGPTFYGHHTANGEMYDGSAMTAAHRTLPMPVNVRVTNLDNGRSVVVRVNDRGPYAKGRIIDLSEAAARELDVIRTGTARVRVTYLARADSVGGAPLPDETPPQIASAVPAAPTEKVDTQALNLIPGAIVAPPAPAALAPVPVVSPSLPPSQADAQPNGEVTKVPVPSVTHIYVQVGAFSNATNANRLRDRFSAAGGLSVSPIGRAGQTLYRVRSGPYDNVADADQALARLNGLGSNDAQIVVDK